MIYVACFLSSTFMAYLASRSKDRGLIILCSVVSILIPCILGGLRAYGIGTDTRIYAAYDCRGALNAPDFFSFLESNRQELGYSALCYVVMKTLGHTNWCYFAYQIITISCVYVGFYKQRKKISLPFALLVWFFLFYSTTYNIIRQYMAASIIFVGFDKLEQRHYFKFTLHIAVAFLFHRSAIIALPIVLGMYIVTTSEALRKNAWLRILVFYGSTGLLILTRVLVLRVVNALPILSKYTMYFTSRFIEENVTIIMATIMTGELVMMIFYSKGASRILSVGGAERNNTEFYRFNVLFCVVYQVAVRFMIGRILLYSALINMIALTALPSFVREKHLKFMVYSAVLSASMFYWLWVCVRGGSGEVWPYRSILD